MPFLGLYSKKILPGILSRRFRYISRYSIAIIAILLIFLFFGIHLFYLNTPMEVNEDLVAALFFKEIFVPMFFLFVAWFILSIKSDESRRDEYQFLQSQPISSNVMIIHFILIEIFRFWWLPAGLCFLYLMLKPAVSYLFLFRMGIVAFLSFSLLVLFSHWLHLKLAVKKYRLIWIEYPTRFHPFIQVVLIFIFAFLQIFWITLTNLFAGLQFLGLLFVISILIAALLLFIPGIFKRWQELNITFISKTEIKTKLRYSGKGIISMKWNPLLSKNLIQAIREQSGSSKLLLSVLLLIAGYLAAMNNDNLHDASDVLLGLFLLYTFFFAVRTIQKVANERESPQCLYSLPIKRSQLYFSYFWPTVSWMAGMLLLLSVLLFISGRDLTTACRFLVQSAFASLLVIAIMLNCTMANYPDSRKSVMQFLYFIFFLIIVSAVFYRYRIWISLFFFFISILPLRKFHLYRV